MVAETMRDRGHRLLVLYLSLVSFALNLSAPYFSAYLLRPAAEHGLAWSYLAFTLVNAITAFFKFLFLPVWGRTADRFGSRKCLVLASWLLSTLPLFWLLPPALRLGPAAICLGQAWAGFVMAGHELSSFNFLLDSSQPAVRPRLVASMNMINGLMVFLGSATGGAAVSLAPRWANPFILVFVLSVLARFAVCAALAGRLREVRIVERIGYRSLFFRVSLARAQFGPLLRFFLVPKEKIVGREARPCPPAARPPLPAPSLQAPGESCKRGGEREQGLRPGRRSSPFSGTTCCAGPAADRMERGLP